MRSKILYTAGSIVALLAVLTIFFSIRPEGFLHRGEAAVTQADVEAAGAAVTFTGRKAWADIPRVTGAEDFMAQYPFEQFTVEPVNAVPTGVYELARWRSSTAVVGHRTRNYSQATTSALWAMTGYNEYYIIEFPDGTHALALFDRGLAADLAKGKAVTLPISARAGVNTYAKPYLQDICAEYDELLVGLKNLQQLDLPNTGFSDCSILLQLPKLKRVNLAHCNLQNEDVLQQLTADIQK